jgi:hypothetical protein
MKTYGFPNGEPWHVFDTEEEQLAWEADEEAREIVAGRIFVSPEQRDLAARYLAGTLDRDTRIRVGGRSFEQEPGDPF